MDYIKLSGSSTWHSHHSPPRFTPKIRLSSHFFLESRTWSQVFCHKHLQAYDPSSCNWMLSLAWKTNSVHAVHSSVQNKIQMAFILQKKSGANRWRDRSPFLLTSISRPCQNKVTNKRLSWLAKGSYWFMRQQYKEKHVLFKNKRILADENQTSIGVYNFAVQQSWSLEQSWQAWDVEKSDLMKNRGYYCRMLKTKKKKKKKRKWNKVIWSGKCKRSVPDKGQDGTLQGYQDPFSICFKTKFKEVSM